MPPLGLVPRLVLWCVLVAAISGWPARAQYPVLIDGSPYGVHQCLSDFDCQGLTVVPGPGPNASLAPSIYCNLATTRCESLDGIITNYDKPCGFTMALTPFDVIYNMSAPDTCDGILRVTFQGVGMQQLHGVLRRFSSLVVDPVEAIMQSTGYEDELFVNSPVLTYHFRRLCADATARVLYIDNRGCSVQASFVVKEAVLPAGTVMAFDSGTGYYTFNGTSMFVADDSRFVKASLDPVWNFADPNYFINGPVGRGYRVPVFQTFDNAGGVISTATGLDAILGPGAGIRFPQGGTVGYSTIARTLLSGTVAVKFGMGYALKVGPTNSSGAFEFITEPCGVIEVSSAEPFYLPMYEADPDLTDRPGYETPMYFQHQGVNFNIKLIETGNLDIFNVAGIDLATFPILDILEQDSNQTRTVYAYCGRPLIVRLNYTELGFSEVFNPAVVDFDRVRTDLVPPGLENIVTSGPLVDIVEFPIIAPGFYCADMKINTGSFLRPALRTCFQVGMGGASLTQVRSRIPPRVDDQNFISQASFVTDFQIDYYPGIPQIFMVDAPLRPIFRLCRMSTDPEDMAQLVTAGADSLDLFNVNVDMFYFDDYYDTIDHGASIEYRLRQSIHSLGAITTVGTPPAGFIPSEVTTVKIEVYNTDTGALEATCSKIVELAFTSFTRLQTRIEVEDAICPNDRALMTAVTTGGFPFDFDSQAYIDEQLALNNTGIIYSYRRPAAYHQSWKNNEPTSPGFGNTLSTGLDRRRYPAPTNIEFELTVLDGIGQTATAVATAHSMVAEDATTVSFMPVTPVCDGGVQYSEIEFFVNGAFPSTSVAYWQPLDVFSNELYNPNVESFDLPSDCPLFSNTSAADIHALCYHEMAMNPMCNGCRNLPIVYPGVDGTRLVTDKDDSSWEAVVWVPSGFFNDITGRPIFCRSANSTRVRVPEPPSAIFTNLRRIKLLNNNVLIPCSGDECFAVTVSPFIESFFQDGYQEVLLVTADPPFGVNAAAVTNGDPLVALDTRYLVTVELPGVICPATFPYVPLARGPLVQHVAINRPSCSIASGTAQIFMTYPDPNIQAAPGQTRPLCLYWPNRDVFEGEVSAVPEFYSFTAGINLATSTTLPFSPAFGAETVFFEKVRAGLHRLIVYDRCPTLGVNCGSDCAAIINQDSFALNNANLAFHIYDFNVSQLDSPAGDIVIQRTNFEEALCYEDADDYVLDFSVFDNRGPDMIGYPPYEVTFYEPFSNDIISQSPRCIGTSAGGVAPEDYINVVENFKVHLFDFEVRIPTGPTVGIGFAGNYTLVVRSCQSGCLASFPTFIDIIQPYDVIVTTVPTTCAFTKGAIVPEITGGAPYTDDDPRAVFYMRPGSTIIQRARYATFWKTPTNPTFVETILPVQNIPGNYTLRVLDRNDCPFEVNITLGSPPPLSVMFVGTEMTCQESIQATLDLFVEGGVPPYRLLQNLTVLQSGQIINFEFIASLNQTLQYHVIDSVGCRLPSPISFEVPDPGPVNVTITTTPSCPGFASGTAVLTPGDLQCSWQSDGRAIPNLATCMLTDLPPGTRVRGTGRNAIGCMGSAFADIGVRPEIIFGAPVRTSQGQFGGQCIDNITVPVAGGVKGFDYTVVLLQDATNATLIYNATAMPQVIRIEGACRSVRYIITVSDFDMQCGVSITVTDAAFGSGGGDDGPPALPAYLGTLDSFGSAGLTQRSKKKPAPASVGYAAIGAAGVMTIIGVSLGVYYAVKDKKE